MAVVTGLEDLTNSDIENLCVTIELSSALVASKLCECDAMLEKTGENINDSISLDLVSAMELIVMLGVCEVKAPDRSLFKVRLESEVGAVTRDDEVLLGRETTTSDVEESAIVVGCDMTNDTVE